jgi:UDP-glucose 4-epimerase
MCAGVSPDPMPRETGTILVTGGCGFIGSNLIQFLSRAGLRVTVLDLEPAPIFFPDSGEHGSGAAHDVEFIVGDIRDRDLCRRAMIGMDAVVHLAAESGIPPSVEDPETNFLVNVDGTLSLLLAAKDAGVQQFILASSGAVLGRHDPPVDERTAASPVSPYGASKLAAEAYCLAFGATYGMSAVALRFANIYGPGSSHKRSVVAEFCKSALRGEPLTIFGDGSQTRDFLYVDDLLVAIHGCLGRPDISGVFQMGCGFGVSVLDVAGVIQGLREGQGPQVPPPDFRPARAFEVHDCYYRIDKAGDAFGFNPSVGFREGVQRTWTWFQKNATGREAATGSSE